MATTSAAVVFNQSFTYLWKVTPPEQEVVTFFLAPDVETGLPGHLTVGIDDS